MARENPTWGQMRVAAELYLKLGILVSPRTVRKYWPREEMTGTEEELLRSTGRHLCANTPMRSWLAISWSQ